MRHGLGNPQIARRRGVSLSAVKYPLANALLKLGLDNRRALMRWPGVARDSALHRNRSTTALNDANHKIPMTAALGAVGQVARSVANIDDATRWYREVLGLRFLYAFGKLAFFDCDGLRLFLAEGEGAAASILYFRVPDIHGATQALQQRGVEFIDAPHLIHRHADGSEEWMAFFNDNEGRPLALMAVVAARVVAPGGGSGTPA